MTNYYVAEMFVPRQWNLRQEAGSFIHSFIRDRSAFLPRVVTKEKMRRYLFFSQLNLELSEFWKKITQPADKQVFVYILT